MEPILGGCDSWVEVNCHVCDSYAKSLPCYSTSPRTHMQVFFLPPFLSPSPPPITDKSKSCRLVQGVLPPSVLFGCAQFVWVWLQAEEEVARREAAVEALQHRLESSAGPLCAQLRLLSEVRLPIIPLWSLLRCIPGTFNCASRMPTKVILLNEKPSFFGWR